MREKYELAGFNNMVCLGKCQRMSKMFPIFYVSFCDTISHIRNTILDEKSFDINLPSALYTLRI
jgi:hypothetical protein